MTTLYVIGRRDRYGRKVPKTNRACLFHPGEVNRWLSDYNEETILEMESQRSGVSVDQLYVILKECKR